MATQNIIIPSTQRAFLQPEVGGPASLVTDFPVVQPKDLLPGQCLVRLSYSGLCHSDLAVKTQSFPMKTKSMLIGGHEGIGIIVAIGEHTYMSPVEVGQRVGVKYAAKSCYHCDLCLKGYESSM
jgi:alcohol dehydrogenase, propanol-preferring